MSFYQGFRVLEINLKESQSQFHSFADLEGLLGGLGLALQLIKAHSTEPQTVLAVGPLTGLFPFASKYCLLDYSNKELTESYGSGRLAMILKFAQIDAIVFSGTARRPLLVSVQSNRGVTFYEDDPVGRGAFNRDGLPGRKSTLLFSSGESFSDSHFSFDANVGRRLYLSNLLGLTVTADQAVPVTKEKDYQEIYQEILKRGQELEVTYSHWPSCGGCPAGCELSIAIEERPELVLSHCLVTCGFAQTIYESQALIFSCLNSLGYSYKHEDLELVMPKVLRLRNNLVK